MFGLNYSLSVSKENKLDCNEMAKYLSENGIVTSITSNISTCPHIEYGCRLTNIVDSKEDINKLWNLLTNKYDFKCGHLKLANIYEGCILNYLRPSLCSTKNSAIN